MQTNKRKRRLEKKTENEIPEEEVFDLSKKYRPQEMKDLVGNSMLKQSLVTAIEKGKLPHTILFEGERGCGKTTIGRILAKELGCSTLDFREIDVADFSGVDTARNIRRSMHTSPMKGKVKVWLLDEIALLGQGGASEKNRAQSALLKALEEPPKHCYFFCCTTDPQNVLPTLKSRCVRFTVQPLSIKSMIILLTRIIKGEGVEVPEEVLTTIAKNSRGIPREAIKMLEKIIHLPEKEMVKVSFESESIDSTIKELCQQLLYKKDWKTIAETLKGIKEEPESIRRAIRGYFAAVLLNGTEKAFIVLDSLKVPFYNTDGKNELVRCIYEAWSDLN